MKLVRPEIMTWRKSSSDPEIVVTDHNRAPLSVTTEEIARMSRMVNGTARKYVVATKRNISISWEMLPTAAGAVVGESSLGILGAEGIKDFIEDTRSSNSCDADFYVRLYNGNDKRPDDPTRTQANINTIINRGDEIRVMVSDFSHEVVKRGANFEGIPFDFWSVSVTLMEV